MRERALIASVSLLLAAACGRERSASSGPAQPPRAPSAAAPEATSRPPAPSAPAPGASIPSPTGESNEPRCLSQEEVDADLALGFKLRSKLAVVRVAPDDVLWLRAGPGARERAVAKLSCDARDVAPTGRACRVGNSTWLEVSSSAGKGFANAAFLMPATEPTDETSRLRKLLGSARFASAAELVDALRRALERQQTELSESRFEATLVGTAQNGVTTVAVVHVCCYADDSVMGEQIVLELTERAGRFGLERARLSRLCPRGTSGGLCI